MNWAKVHIAVLGGFGIGGGLLPANEAPRTGEDRAGLRLGLLPKVGSYPAWRLGKKALRYYLALRFGQGNPFHAGVLWRGMEIGLKAMSKLMAK